MIEIKYNYFLRSGVNGGDKCSVLGIDEITPSVSNEKTSTTPCIQNYDCGFRRDGSHGDYSSWNGTVFIDIDSKKFYKEFKYRPFKVGIISTLEMYYPHNYCWNQTSGSGNSIHIVLYFDCERNENNFKKCCELAKKIIIDCATKSGEQFVEIINYPSVLDDCTTHVGQPLYISAHHIHKSKYYDQVDGECDLSDIEIKENEYTESEISFSSKAKVKYKSVFSELPDYEYKSTRWPLCWIIFNYFEFDKERCTEVWDRITPLILEHRKDYSKKELDEQFNRDYKSSKGKTYAFKSSLLEWCKINLGFEFKINRKFIPKEIDLYNADIEYTLKENEYLSDIDIKFCNGFNHIFAGCGVGKTRFAIEYGKNHRVCFISPMTSINRNSFSGIDNNWLIIDSNYKSEVEYICGSVKNALEDRKWSICTTWESFSLYEMYKYNFDVFIIDESHSMYMYDYRVKSIQNLKTSLKNIKSVVIFMSGTPSYEIYEFDCYKIKINKEITHVKCDLLFYNEQYKGYILNDIKKWIEEDKDNLALVFYDKTNYRTEDDFKYYGIDVEVFNKNYRDNTDWILKNENVRSQVTAFSVYGQAGINIYIDTSKKIRMYILNTNALSIVQYANRVRNKEVIDKIIIPYKIERIDNNIVSVDEKPNFEEAYTKVDMINQCIKYENRDVFSLVSKKQLFLLRFGLPNDVLNINDGYVLLRDNIYETWKMIDNINKYEKQIQLIYNHLVSNHFDVNMVYLEEDTKTSKRTKMRSNQFAGQIIRFDFDEMVKMTGDMSRLYITPSKNFEKYCTGNTIEVIEYILNNYWNEGNNIVDVKNKFTSLIRRIVKEKGSVKKIDLERYRYFLQISKDFPNYVDNAFLISLQSDEVSVERATAIYGRYIYSSDIDWKSACDEIYPKMRRLKKIVTEYREFFESQIDNVNKLNIENDDITKMIYTYVMGKHGGKLSNGVIIDGVRYNNQREAAKKLGKSLSWISRHKKE